METTITQIVEAIYGAGYQNLEPIVGKGKNNQVFKIKVGGTLHILRLSNSVGQIDLYKKEKWCAKAAREAGIKTPAITNVGSVDGWSYSFQEYIEGTHGTDADKEEVWLKLGQIAKDIHQIPASGISLNYTKKIDDLFKNDFFLEKGVFSAELSNKVINRLNEALSWEFSPALCHGNLHPSNVVLDTEGNLWLFDWETATGNVSPQADLAEIYTWNNGKDNIAKFCEGYGLSELDVQTVMRDTQTLILLRLVEVVQRMIVRNGGVMDRDNEYIKNTVERLEGIGDYQADILFTKNL